MSRQKQNMQCAGAEAAAWEQRERERTMATSPPSGGGVRQYLRAAVRSAAGLGSSRWAMIPKRERGFQRDRSVFLQCNKEERRADDTEKEMRKKEGKEKADVK